MTEVKKHSSKPAIKIGDKFKTNCSGVVEVIWYNHANDIGVRFLNGYERSATSGNLQKGKVKNPTHAPVGYGGAPESAAIVLGSRHTNGMGYGFTVLKYHNYLKVEVKFDSGFQTVTSAASIRKKTISDDLSPSVRGVGFLGVGEYTTKNANKAYKHWVSMMSRGYSEDYKTLFPTYREVSVCKEWHNFQTFVAWCEKQIGFSDKDSVLDKDILFKGNKEYNPSNCVFVPHKINALFVKCDASRGDYPIGVYFATRAGRLSACIGIDGQNVNLGFFNDEETAFSVYKKAKEKHIKHMADKYKDQISKECYDALYNYTVEITD